MHALPTMLNPCHIMLLVTGPHQNTGVQAGYKIGERAPLSQRVELRASRRKMVSMPSWSQSMLIVRSPRLASANSPHGVLAVSQFKNGPMSRCHCSMLPCNFFWNAMNGVCYEWCFLWMMFLMNGVSYVPMFLASHTHAIPMTPWNAMNGVSLCSNVVGKSYPCHPMGEHSCDELLAKDQTCVFVECSTQYRVSVLMSVDLWPSMKLVEGHL